MPPGSDAPAHHPFFDVVCIGLLTSDTIVPMPGWPEPDGRMVVEPVTHAAGGPAATAAVAIARLGGSVAFIGVVADDPDGSALLAGLAAEGIATDHVETRPGSGAQSVILVDRTTGTRSILHASGVRPDALDDAGREACASAHWVHVDHAGHALASELPPDRLSVDDGNLIDGLELDGLGLYAPTRSALLARFPGRPLENAVAAALDEGARRVVVSLGRDGALAADQTGAWRVPAAPIDVISTLGAGDVFHGALLAALVAGHEMPQALRRANLAAALSCRALDGRSAIPATAELDAALAGAPRPEPISLEENR
jgi:sugar/nucleoside kinase (ribokinase family)